jgi:hypothetical protein
MEIQIRSKINLAINKFLDNFAGSMEFLGYLSAVLHRFVTWPDRRGRVHPYSPRYSFT